MKTRKTNEETTAPSPKGKLKIKDLHLNKQTIQDLSDEDGSGIKGGALVLRTAAPGLTCGSCG